MCLKIGNILINSNVILAPMAGVTDLPFRAMVSSFNPDILSFSEMISSEALVRKNSRTIRMLKSNQKIQAVQIAGGSVENMAESAKINADYGADIIDINMGCPAKKIVNNYAGSWLMRDEKLAINIIKAVVNSVNIPVSLKMRLGWDHYTLNALTIAKAAEELGVAMITIHGRTRCQMYSGKANWDAIGLIKASIKSIPVICNGDIISEESAATAIQSSKCSGIMIGRAAIGRPWLLNKILCKLNNIKDNTVIQAKQITETINKHLMLSIDFYGRELGIKTFRKHLLAYTKGFHNSAKFRNDLLILENEIEIIEQVRVFFEDATEKQICDSNCEAH